MLFSHATFIGIDPSSSRKFITYAAFDADLQLIAIGEGELEEIIAFAGGQESSFICITSPSKPNQNLMRKDAIRSTLSPSPRPGRWYNFRVAEYHLYQMNIRIPRTPSQIEDSPSWVKMGFKIFRRLESLGFRYYPSGDHPKQLMETYPQAAYTVLLGHHPFKKNSLEGRIQRQLLLREQKAWLSDPMQIFEEITRYRILQGVLPLNGLHTPKELDALVASFTAWLAANHPERTTRIGHPDEGYIILPSSELKSKY